PPPPSTLSLHDALPISHHPLFRRLPDHYQRAMPSIFVSRHDLRRADPRGHVNVVSARMHDRDIGAVVIFGADMAGVGEAGLFLRSEEHTSELQSLAYLV